MIRDVERSEIPACRGGIRDEGSRPALSSSTGSPQALSKGFKVQGFLEKIERSVAVIIELPPNHPFEVLTAG